MFIFDVGDDEFGLKPMNCPATPPSSRILLELPRFADPLCGKREGLSQKSNAANSRALAGSGPSRSTTATFVRPEQIKVEVEQIMDMITDVLDTFDLEYDMALATRPEKSVGSDEIWDRAEEQLESVPTLTATSTRSRR